MMISVIMSIYKTNPDYIRESINSILNQTYSDFEFIIINNGNDLGVKKLLNQYDDCRIRILETKTLLTLYESRTLGIKKSKSDWIALMDADDISLPTRFETQISFLNENKSLNIGCIGSWARYLNEESKIIGYRNSRPTNIEDFNLMKESNDAIITTDPSSLINKKIFFQVGGYRKEYSPAADLDLWYRFVENGSLILSMPEYLLLYRIHKDADSSKKFMLQRKKTHFANLNMKRRRSNQPEIDYDQFNENYWSKYSFRFFRQWRNYAKYYYKKAGLDYFMKNYISLLINLFFAFILNPFYVLNRILSHVFNIRSL